MSEIDFPIYDRQELEIIGEEFLKKHLKPPFSIPIDIDYLIEVCGYEVMGISNLLRDHGVKGVPVFWDGRAGVCIDRDHLDRQPAQSRFTEAEELGHILLHSSVYEDCKNLEESMERYQALPGEAIDKMDRNARYLAGIILIPKESLRLDIQTFIKSADYSKYDSIHDLIAALYEPLAKKYVVSELTLKYRITNAAFLDLKQTLQEEYLKRKKR